MADVLCGTPAEVAALKLTAQNWGNLVWGYATLGRLPRDDLPDKVYSLAA